MWPFARKGDRKPVQKPVQKQQQVSLQRNTPDNLARIYAAILSDVMIAQRIAGRLERCDRGPRYLTLGVGLNDPTQLKSMIGLAESFALACHVRAVIAQRSLANPGLLSLQFELSRRLWQECTAASVRGGAVGITEGSRQVPFALDPPHTGVFGTSQASGKSVTVRAILLSLLRTHTPDDLRLVIVDPHADHAALANSAHLALPIAAEPDEVSRALEWTAGELASRRAARDRDRDILVLVIDEAQLILADPRNLEIVRRLGQEAGKFRVHLVLATQKPMEAYIPGILANIANRYVGLVVDSRTSGMLTGQGGLSCHKLTGHGDFIHVAGAGVQRLQVAHVLPADFASIPHADVAWPSSEPAADTPRLLNIPETPPRGRPRNELDGATAAAYYHYGPAAITESQAAGQLGLSRRMHDRYKEFVTDFGRALAGLQERDK